MTEGERVWELAGRVEGWSGGLIVPVIDTDWDFDIVVTFERIRIIGELAPSRSRSESPTTDFDGASEATWCKEVPARESEDVVNERLQSSGVTGADKHN